MSRSHTSLFSLRPGLTGACLTLALGAGGLLAGLPAHAQFLTVGKVNFSTFAPLGDGSATISNSGTSVSGSYQFQATNGNPALDPATSTYDSVSVYTPNSTLTVAGGKITGLSNLGTTSISGGTIGTLYNATGTSPYNNTSVPGGTSISGGTITDLENITGTTDMTGGTLLGGHNAVTAGYPTSIFNMSGGTITGAYENDTIANLTGGTIAEFDSFGSTTISGGTFGTLSSHNSGLIDILGSNLTESLKKSDGTYTITGTLLNGTSPFTAVFSDYTTDGNGLEFNGVAAAPVPELSSATQMMLLLCLSALALVKLRKKKPASAHAAPGAMTARS